MESTTTKTFQSTKGGTTKRLHEDFGSEHPEAEAEADAEENSSPVVIPPDKDIPPPKNFRVFPGDGRMYEEVESLGKCWVPTEWFPGHKCGHPPVGQCQRGWDVFPTQADCCKEGAAFTSGCYEPLLPADDQRDSLVQAEALPGDESTSAADEAYQQSHTDKSRLEDTAVDAGARAREPEVGQGEPEGGQGLIGSIRPKAPKTASMLAANAKLTTAKLHQEPAAPLNSILSQDQFRIMFPHANDHSEPAIYTYQALLTAAEKFPNFAQEGDESTRKRELAAFLAHISYATSGWFSGQEWLWGLVYTRENGCENKGACTEYNQCDGELAKSNPCTEGKDYYGRGPMQVSYNYNYGEVSRALYNDLRLLEDPDILASDGVAAFVSALWFWMEARGEWLGKPSCHTAMVDFDPSESDVAATRSAGFGLTINVINGGDECNQEVVPNAARHRINYFLRYCNVLGVDPGPGGSELDCSQQVPYSAHVGTQASEPSSHSFASQETAMLSETATLHSTHRHQNGHQSTSSSSPPASPSPHHRSRAFRHRNRQGLLTPATSPPTAPRQMAMLEEAESSSISDVGLQGPSELMLRPAGVA